MVTTAGPGSSAGVPSRQVARGGALALFGAVFSAAAGFVLVVLLGRLLGAHGTGIVLQAIAAFTIAMTVGKAGLDTTAVWILPQLNNDRPARVGQAIRILLTLAAGGGIAASLLLAGAMLIWPDVPPELSSTLWWMVWALPAATVMTVGLAITRGLGSVRPFVLLGSITVPGLRPLLVLAVVAAGGEIWALGASWVLPFLVALVAVLLILARRPAVPDAVPTPAGTEDSGRRPLLARIGRYTLPRSIATVLEQLLQWVDVLVVGLLAGPVAAGLYGAATRLVGAGLILSTALRIVVAPMYSRLLSRQQTGEVQQLYGMTTSWIVFLSAPLYLTLALFSGTVLSIFGAEFREAGLTLSVLAGGLLVVLLAGNVQSVLLMSGHSTRSAVNKAIAVAVNLAGLFLLVGVLDRGIIGAAAAWVVAALVDVILASAAVGRLVRVRVLPPVVGLSAGMVLLAFGAPAALARLRLGDDWPGLGLGLLAGVLGWAATAYLLRNRLRVCRRPAGG